MRKTASEHYKETASESAMERGIKEKVLHLGGRFWHVRDSRGQDVKDMPDMLIVLPAISTVMLWETKSRSRKIEPGQQSAISAIQQCERVHSRIIRPWDYDSALDFLETGEWE